MTVVLARIDDRLIHGQVVVGWCTKLRPDRIVLANDQIAGDDWQARVYTSTVPPHIAGDALTLANAARQLTPPGAWAEEATLLLTASPEDMLAVVERGLDLDQVNIGGMHFGEGKQEVLPFLFVDRQDVTALRRLVGKGLRLVAQQVPATRGIELTADDLQEMEDRF